MRMLAWMLSSTTIVGAISAFAQQPAPSAAANPAPAPIPEPDPLEGEAEAGLVMAGGNTVSETYNFKQALGYSFDGNVFKQAAKGLYGKTGKVPSASSYMLTLRYERELFGQVSAFFAETAEGDRFAGQDPRWSSDIGGRYNFIEGERTKLATDLGYRYSRVRYFLIAQTEAAHYGRLLVEGKHQITESVNLTASLEYLPNFTFRERWKFHSEISGSVILSRTFSLKTSHTLRFDNAPAAGKKKRDTLLTTALVAKF